MCLGIEPLFDLSIFIAIPNIKVSHDQYIICTNNMAASNGTVGQTGNDFMISEQHLIMHCKFTNALYQHV
jgi:hypothetical protein